jgi:uncharacterized protein YjdB
MNKLMNIILAFILILCVTVSPVLAGTFNGTIMSSRLSGQDRYQTTRAIATAMYSGTVQNVVLATGNNYPDALSGSVFAGKLSAPILLVDSTLNASSEAFGYIHDHLAKNGTVYLLGSIIGPEFSDSLTNQGYTLQQIGGSDRYETSLLIAQNENVPVGTPLVIASGENYPDALSISSFATHEGWPILLVSKDYLPDAVKNYITNDKPAKVYIAGGPGVVSNDIQTEISSSIGNVNITRLSGEDRFATGIAIAEEFASNPKHIYVASSENFPDALTGSVLAAQTGSPIVLVDPDSSTLSSSGESYLRSIHVFQGNVPDVIALGGASVVPDALVSSMQDLLSGITPPNSKDSGSGSVGVPPGVTGVMGISLNKTALSLTAGGATGPLVATVFPANATNQAITWTTSAADVATVVNGVVTPLKIGTALITATTEDGAKAAACTVAVTTVTSGGLGVADSLSGFTQYYPLLAGNAAPATTFAAFGVALPDKHTYDIGENCYFITAPFNSYPALSPLPTQGLTMNISSEKTCVITNVDGYTLNSTPNNVMVEVNSIGEVSINKVALWKAQSGYKVVGYLPGSTSGSYTLIEENLSTPTQLIGIDVPIVGSDGIQEAAWTLPSTSLPKNFEEFLGFNVNANGQLQPIVASYFANHNRLAPYSTSVSTLTPGIFAPVEVAQVYADDNHSEAAAITVSSSLNSKTATITAYFTSGAPLFPNDDIRPSPNSVNQDLGNTQTITFKYQDAYGNPIANQTVYVGTGIPGLWITQVNGKTITESVNMGTTSSPLMQTVNTPVPLFNLGIGDNAPAYSSVSVTGLTASLLNDNTSPVVTLTTDNDGITITLADGNVTYVANTGSTTALNGYKIDPGTAISQQRLPIFYDSDQTTEIGSVLLNWGSNPPVPPVPPVPVTLTGLSLNQTTLTLTAGGVPAVLSATAVPSNAPAQVVNWSSSNANVEVATNGVVTPVSAGTAIITATTQDGSISAACTVTVAAP